MAGPIRHGTDPKLTEPLTNPEIVAAITAGGVVLNSAEPVNTVGSILRRRQNDQEDIVRVGKTWGLAAWYPNAGRFNRRGRKDDGKSEGKKRKRPPVRAASELTVRLALIHAQLTPSVVSLILVIIGHSLRDPLPSEGDMFEHVFDTL